MAIKQTIRLMNVLDASTFQFPTTPNTVLVFDTGVHVDYFSAAVPRDGWLVRPNTYVHEFIGDTLAVFEYDEDDIMYTDSLGPVVSEMKLIYAGTGTESDSVILSYLNLSALTSAEAFAWGQNIGDKDMVGPYITDENLFTPWVKYIYPEDHDRVLALLTTASAAANWGIEIGDRDAIRHLITTSDAAFTWALSIPAERPAMKLLITDPLYIDAWNNTFPGDPIIP